MDLQAATPAEIDTQLAEIYGRYYAKRGAATEAQAAAARYDLRSKPGARFESPGYEKHYAELRHEAIETANALLAEATVILAEAAPYDAEFDRRGTWTRAFLVDNTNGHVHRTMACGTCHATTQFTWITEFSGRTETEVVEAAGEKACTVCYPTAPVDVLRRPSTIEAPARRAARLERDAKKAARDAARAAKAITAADGGKLLDTHRFEIKTIVTAWNTVVDIVFSHRVYNYPAHTETVTAITEALAARLDRTVEDITAEIQAKVIAKSKRTAVRY